MSIAIRLKELRKNLKMNQQEFADNIKMAKISVARWESETLNISESTALLICEKFNVNYDWLMYGNGDMFKPKEETIATIKKEHPDITDVELDILEKWFQLSHDDRVYLLKKLKFLFDGKQKKDTD